MEAFSALLALCTGHSPATGEFPYQGPVTRSFDVSSICAWMNGWINNHDASDLRRHCVYYDVTVMLKRKQCCLGACVIWLVHVMGHLPFTLLTVASKLLRSYMHQLRAANILRIASIYSNKNDDNSLLFHELFDSECITQISPSLLYVMSLLDIFSFVFILCHFYAVWIVVKVCTSKHLFEYY